MALALALPLTLCVLLSVPLLLLLLLLLPRIGTQKPFHHAQGTDLLERHAHVHDAERRAQGGLALVARVVVRRVLGGCRAQDSEVAGRQLGESVERGRPRGMVARRAKNLEDAGTEEGMV